MSDPDVIRVSVVEDETRFRESLALLIDGSPGLTCAGTHADGSSALLHLPEDNPHVVLLDINLPKLDGIEALRSLKPAMPDTQFIMLTAYHDDERIFESLKAGASGYLLKRSTPAEILEAVQDVHAGGSPMTSAIARRVVQSFSRTENDHQEAAKTEPAKQDPAGVSLSPREREVLDLLCKGFLYKEIASELGLSIDTIRTYLRRVYEKLQVHSRTEAVVKYLKEE